MKELKDIPEKMREIIRQTRDSIHLSKGSQSYQRSSKLQGWISMHHIYDLRSLEAAYQLPSVRSLTMTYLADNLYSASNNPVFELSHLISAPLEVFNTLQVAVPTFNDYGDTIHHACCTGAELFQKWEQRSDWVFVRCHKARKAKSQGTLDGRVPTRLNALFKLRDLHANTSYCLAYVSLLSIIGSPTPDRLEGMVQVGLPMRSHIVAVADIERMAHLAPVNLKELYLVNNRIDVHTCNDIYDRN